MKARELAGLLRILKAAGVTRYTADGVSVTFGDVSPQGQETAPAQDGDLDLPHGVIDPRAKLAEIYKKRARAA